MINCAVWNLVEIWKYVFTRCRCQGREFFQRQYFLGLYCTQFCILIC